MLVCFYYVFLKMLHCISYDYIILSFEFLFFSDLEPDVKLSYFWGSSPTKLILVTELESEFISFPNEPETPPDFKFFEFEL